MLTFTCPTIVYGDNALDYILQIEEKKALIVTDKNCSQRGLIKLVTDHLDAAQVHWRTFDIIEAEPSCDSIKRGGITANGYQPDWIIGLGGSACMDVAKSIAGMLTKTDRQPNIIAFPNARRLNGKAKLMIIPTSSHTDDEGTHKFQTNDTGIKHHFNFETAPSKPDVAILDPEMFIGMPPQATADSGMSVICKAIEGYVSARGSSITDGPALIAARQAFEYLPNAYEDGDRFEARMEMQHAAILADLSSSNTRVGLSYCTGQALSAIHNIPSGRAMGLLLPYTMEYLINGSIQITARYAEMARYCGKTSGSNMDCALSLVDMIRKCAEKINQPLCIKECGIHPLQFQASLSNLVKRTLTEGLTMNVSRVPDEKELKQILRYAYEGLRIDF